MKLDGFFVGRNKENGSWSKLKIDIDIGFDTYNTFINQGTKLRMVNFVKDVEHIEFYKNLDKIVKNKETANEIRDYFDFDVVYYLNQEISNNLDAGISEYCATCYSTCKTNVPILGCSMKTELV